MGNPRTLHSSHRRPRLPGAGETRLKSSICLIALLALIVVPLAHQHHLHSLEGFSPPPALGVEIQGDLQLSSPKPEDPDHHHHNAVTCPICQAALSSRYCAVTTLSLDQVLSLPVQRYCHNAITSLAANPDVLVLGSRAPPISL